MALLTAPSEAAHSIAKVLNLPKNTTAFTLRMRIGEDATLEVETLVSQEEGEALATVLQHYLLEEIEGPNAGRNRTSPPGD